MSFVQMKPGETNDHKKRHIMLHNYFDELLADWIAETKELPSKITLADFLKWSYQQTQSPTKRSKETT